MQPAPAIAARIGAWTSCVAAKAGPSLGALGAAERACPSLPVVVHLTDGGRLRAWLAVTSIDMTRDCDTVRSEEHTSELQSLMRISYSVFCLKKNIKKQN